MAVIFLFIDGVGLGSEEASNPFFTHSTAGFERIAGGAALTLGADEILAEEHVFKPLDATLGVDGLPQSGTGQTALFTGKNAPKEIGRHFGPYPHSGIKKFLKKGSLFHQAQDAGFSCTFLNAYPDIFFRKSEERNRWTSTTLMARSAGIRLYGEEDLKNEEALTAELTQSAWRERLGIEVPEITPEEAAARLVNLSGRHSLLLHEYYLTDKAGHAKDHEQATKYLEMYGRFLDTLIQEKRREDTIVLSSDHGNLEDLSVKTHTRNPVPLFSYGPGSEVFFEADSIMDVTPGILRLLKF